MKTLISFHFEMMALSSFGILTPLPCQKREKKNKLSFMS